MRRSSKFLSFLIMALLLGGCATVRPRSDSKPAAPSPKVQIQELQEELRQKDEEIKMLEEELMHYRSSSSGYSTKPKRSSSSDFIGRSVNVSVRSVQQALKNAGYYRGAVDGKAGAKTREAIKAFQRANGLEADGVVGPRTWKKLSRY